MEVGRVKAVATICLVFWMIVGQPSAASKCYDDCYSACLPEVNTPMKCDIKCKSECGETPPPGLTHSCKTSCALKFCSNPKLGTSLSLSHFICSPSFLHLIAFHSFFFVSLVLLSLSFHLFYLFPSSNCFSWFLFCQRPQKVKAVWRLVPRCVARAIYCPSFSQDFVSFESWELSCLLNK